MIRGASQNLRASQGKSSKCFAILKGTIFGYGAIIPFFITFALILTYTKFPEKYISLAVMITSIISIMYAGSVSAKGFDSKGWLQGGFTGLFYMLILYLASSVIFKKYTLDRTVLTNGLIGILSGITGGIIGTNTKSKKRRKIKQKTKVGRNRRL